MKNVKMNQTKKFSVFKLNSKQNVTVKYAYSNSNSKSIAVETVKISQNLRISRLWYVSKVNFIKRLTIVISGSVSNVHSPSCYLTVVIKVTVIWLLLIAALHS
jgi:hypothetical protein